MSRKASRKKASKKHTTVIPAAEGFLRVLVRRPEVMKYTCGFIKSGLRAAPQRVKVAELSSKVLSLKVRGTIAVQEIKIYTTDLAATKRALQVFLAGKRA